MTGRRFEVVLIDSPALARRHGGDILPLADVPTCRRLAQVLKRLGRTYGFRCESIAEAEPKLTPGASEDATPGPVG